MSREKGAPRERIKTANDVENAKPEPTQYERYDTDVKGLALRVSVKGRKTWSLYYRNAAGKPRRLSLGVFPGLTLKGARKAASAAKNRISEGRDPAKERQAARAAPRLAITSVSDLVEAYLEAAEKGRHRPNARPNKASTVRQDRYYHDRLIKPKLGKRPAKEVSRTEARTFLEGLADDHGPTAARMCGTLLRASFNFGMRREEVETNPFAMVEIPRAGKRERVLTSAELAKVWGAAKDPEPLGVGVSKATGLAIMLAMTTLQRGGEVCGIRESELDDRGRTWTIPGERTKNHLTHVVPLSLRARAIIKLARRLRESPADRQNDAYLFPSPRGDGPLTRAALTRAMARITEKLEIENATLHDTRRTGATNITGERIGLPRFIVSRVLNQISDTGGAAAVTGVYDRNEYLAEKRKALDAWGRLLASIARQH